MVKISNKTLSTKDDIGLQESLKLIKHFRPDMESGLIIPECLKLERKKVCGYCGRPWDNKLTARYFGELFHEQCVQAMQHGERHE